MSGDEEHVDFKFYHYDPSMAGAVIFVLIFLGSSAYHSWQVVCTRTWAMIPIVIGGLFETIGYGGRAASANESPDWSMGPYIIQSILLLLGPALFAATIYMLLGRIILAIDGESRSMISKKWLTKLFILGDVLSFLLQGSGGGIQSSGTLTAMETGTKIIIGGLFVQLAFFGFFVVVALSFDYKISRSPTSISAVAPWRKHMTMLYVASALIMVRSVFRAIEYLQGHDGYLLGHEIYLYIFDAILMAIVMLIFNVTHPSGIVRLASQGKWPYESC